MPAMNYRGLTVKQPFAGMIAAGKKTLELRSWNTRYRGPLLITSSKVCGFDRLEIAPPPESIYNLHGWAICIVTLEHCRPMRREDEAAAYYPYVSDANVFVFSDVVRLAVPVEVSGALGLWHVEKRVPDSVILELATYERNLKLARKGWIDEKKLLQL